MSGSHWTRREWLAGLGVSLTAGVAGCGTVRSDDTPTEDPYAHLRTKRVYVADSLSITLPDGVDAAASPGEADVVVLPSTTDRSNETAVDWFVAGKHVALLGHESEGTYHEWKRSDAYAEAFGEPQGFSEGRASSGSGGGGGATSTPEPPELVVAWAVGDDRTTTYNATWGHTDDPSDEEVLTAVESALDDEGGATSG